MFIYLYNKVMSIQTVIILILGIGISFLIVYLIKSVIIPKKIASAANLLSKNENLKAMRAAKAAIEKDPKNVEAHYILGKVYLADKREEQALREFVSVNRLGVSGTNIPETEFREAVAVLYAKFNEPDEALKEYILLIRQHPENPEYYFQAGKLFFLRNRANLADQYLRKAVLLNPTEARYNFELGLFYFLSKRIKDAATQFETVLKLNPSDGEALLYMGKIYKGTKDYAGSIPYLEKAARVQEYKLRALVELGGSYMSLNMISKAIAELERAVNIIQNEADHDSLHARYFLAMCFEKTREHIKAVAQWEKIYVQKKNFKDVGEKLAKYSEFKTNIDTKASSG